MDLALTFCKTMRDSLTSNEACPCAVWVCSPSATITTQQDVLALLDKIQWVYMGFLNLFESYRCGKTSFDPCKNGSLFHKICFVELGSEFPRSPTDNNLS